ncbi:hypothetical protein PF001_g15040 [Phytophthora fragariae]|uniref:Uncharacterized protein n=1 Tax=Phytophthora fragariae TaxID=53985 RepID=A0A6A4D0W0_9STRA|nr:hypothetical protein PF001_g15040 [Phytophthora fragariae]
MDKRFTVNPFGRLELTAQDRAQLVQLADELVLAKFEEYEEHLNNQKQVDLNRWKKFTKSGPTTTYLERKNSNPDSKLPALLMLLLHIYNLSSAVMLKKQRSPQT